ncbi:MAG TPA: prepilin-type N-terminal cleavage/methylation domain-containing protein [Candidatus Deferrimicrobiaceae bacterium]|nr:prepilin-type N-terminal cleavage/methylation domain-containing protein [Candidatus Deferrimicrobiaceae bacterium]
MNRTDGFTLIEITVALVIVGIMAFLAVPNFKQWVHHTRFTGFVRDAYTEFQQGRNRAMTTGIAHEVVVDTINETIRLRHLGTTPAFVRQEIKAPSTCDIVAGGSVTFNTDGTASSNGNVQIVNKYNASDNQTITVTLGTARVKLQ